MTSRDLYIPANMTILVNGQTRTASYCIPNEPEIGEPDIDAEKFIDAEDIMISALERMVCLRRFA